MGTALSVLSVVGSVGSGIGSYQASRAQAKSAQANAEAQARLYEQNASRARSEAEATAKAGYDAESQQREKVRRTRAAQAAAYGASGVSLAGGSAQDVMVDTDVQGERDAAAIRTNYQRQRHALLNEATGYDAQAQLARNVGNAQASAAKASGYAALGGSLLSGAGLVASKWGSTFSSGSDLWGGWRKSRYSKYGTVAH